MPRPARRSKSRRSGYSAMDVAFLSAGPHGVPCLMTAAETSGDEATIREAWNELRDAILTKWIAEKPGSRPWGWWRFDSLGRRERTDGRPHPFDDKARTLHVAASDRPDFWKRAYRLTWGMPSIYISPFDRDLYDDFMVNILAGRESTIFEPEWSYLARLNLLLPEDSP